MSVYRELSAELQASKAMLDSLNQQNQQLVRQNQQFRQEIERLSASVLNLQQIAGLPQPGWGAPTRADQEDAMAIADQIRLPVRPPSTKTAPKTAQKKPARPPAIPNAAGTNAATASASADPLRFTEQPSGLPVGDLSESSPRDLSGLWLWFTVLAIIITAFGAGFMVVRPLLPNSGK
ncbi:MAG: hypothetical protein Fur0046_16800 [Cyanobacteria bacterium J069]|nr:MAG: hypothetical protein D6742_14720 [Cyanobacteria bacterium J069]